MGSNDTNSLLIHIVDHPFGFLLVCVGIYIVFNALSKNISQIKEITVILMGEFRRGKNKTLAERLNAVAVLMLFFLCFLIGVFELCPSAIMQVLGGQNISSVSYNFSVILLLFFISLIGSPYWISRFRKEEAIKKKINESLDR